MKRYFYRLIVITVFIMANFFLWSFQQNDPVLEKILSYFSNLQSEFPTEKVYLHFDKNTYTLGENIWFSAYLTAGGTQVPSPLSRTLYVDLFDAEGDLLVQKKILIEDGFGHGDFKLPDFGTEGVYRIKAYTAWMENDEKEYFFTCNINVHDALNTAFFPSIIFEEKVVLNGGVRYTVNLDVLNSKGQPLAGELISIKVIGDGEQFSERGINLNSQGQVSFSFQIPNQPFKSQWLELIYLENGEYAISKKVKIPYSFQLADIQFLPEGGYLVNGLKSNIAFKGIYPDGSPVELEGEVLGLAESVKFNTFFGGMGKFELTPEEGESYEVKVFDTQSQESKIIGLPNSKEKGLVVQVLNNPSLAYITVFIQGNYEEEELILVSHTRGMINYMVKGALNNGIWGVRIPKDNIFSGINQITVLNQSGKIILERLVFHQQENSIINLGVVKSNSISSRSLVELEINSKIAEMPAEGNFSVSITDADQVSPPYANYLFSTLLLTSDLKGDIYQPSYYFKDKNEETLQALDLLMMTNGWSRINWSNVYDGKYPDTNRLIERGISIEGIVKDKTNSKKGLRGGEVTAMIGNGEEIISTPYVEDGKFLLPNLEFFEDKDMSISAKDGRLRDYVDIEIFKQKKYFDKINPGVFSDLNTPKNLLESFAARQMMTRLFEDEMMVELDAVEVQSKSLEDENMQERRMYGKGDVIIKPENILGSDAFTNIFQMIQGRVSGVQVFVSGMSVSVLIRGAGTINAGSEPLYLLDNMQVDAETLMSLNPRDVAAIDVFKDPAKASIFGSQGANGAIAVYTKTGIGSNDISTGNLVSNVSGYSVAKEFYQPNYETQTAENSIPDKRSTIYWNPRLSIDESGKAKIKYYNTDVAKKHLVFIEGMDKQGRLAQFVTILE